MSPSENKWLGMNLPIHSSIYYYYNHNNNLLFLVEKDLKIYNSIQVESVYHQNIARYFIDIKTAFTRKETQRSVEHYSRTFVL